MTLEHLLSNYGYLAIFVGCFLEGETIMVLGGLAAHQGYLGLQGVVLAGFSGSLLGDQTFFLIGRHYGLRLLARRPAWLEAGRKVEERLGKSRDLFIIGFRFLYGLRTVSPFVLGMSSVPFVRFAVLNATGAAIWAAVVGGAGYAFGSVVEHLIDRAKQYEVYIFAGIAALAAAFFIYRHLRARRRERHHEEG